MAQKAKTGGAAQNEALQAKQEGAGRGGARLGAGRKSGSGAFGEATLPMRIPVSLAPHVEKALEDFKAQVSQGKDASAAVAPLDAKALCSKSISLPSGAPSGKPVDLGKILAKKPESCFAWSATKDIEALGILAGDTVVIDRSAKPVPGSIVAIWGGSGIELSRRGKGAKQPDAWGVAVALARAFQA